MKDIKNMIEELSKPVIEIEIKEGKNIITRRHYNETDINKYGRLRLSYLRNFKRIEYEYLLMEDKLTKHLVDISSEALKLFYDLMDEFIEDEYVLTQEYKKIDQLDWVRNMNYYKKVVEEIVISNVVYNSNN